MNRSYLPALVFFAILALGVAASVQAQGPIPPASIASLSWLALAYALARMMSLSVKVTAEWDMRCFQMLLLSAALVLPGCGGGLVPARPLAYSAVIDPAFSTSEVEAITAALDDWNTAVPELQITYAIAACDSPLPREVCFHPNHDPPNMRDDVVGDTQPSGSEGATVMLYVNRIEASRYHLSVLLRQTAEHEMGHAMGLKHSASGTLMAPYVEQQAPGATSADVAQFWSVSGEPASELQNLTLRSIL
jgi:hypothetical protein